MSNEIDKKIDALVESGKASKYVGEMTLLFNDYQEHIEKEAIEALKSLYLKNIKKTLRSGDNNILRKAIQAIVRIDADKMKFDPDETKFDRALKYIIENVGGKVGDDELNLWNVELLLKNNDIKLLDEKKSMAQELVKALSDNIETPEDKDKLTKVINLFNSPKFQENPVLLEERRKPSKFWKLVDSFLKLFGGPTSTMGVTGVNVNKKIHGFFGKAGVTDKMLEDDREEAEAKAMKEAKKAKAAKKPGLFDKPIVEVPAASIEAFKCPITEGVMAVAMICSDGHSYEKRAIKEQFQNNNFSSPITGKKITKDIIVNRALNSAIEEFNTGGEGEPEAFCCPITYEIMQDPVICSDGNSYERAAITEWFEKNDTSPLTGEKITKNVITNKTLKKAIEEWEKNPGLFQKATKNDLKI